jgi:oxygen-independent coproporphyrinogen-3 oxidase
MDQSLIFDVDLIRRYDKSGPRYTSYPTAVQFHEGFGENEYRQWAQNTNVESRKLEQPAPLSLYFHLPFCDTVCFYCGCNKVVTKDRSKSSPYIARLKKELELQTQLFDDNRIVTQLHWGGGTPTFINHDEMRDLMETTRKYFTLADNDTGEFSIEIDPREVRADTISLLRELGFNRMSMGVQDFDDKVQKAVNRIQSEEETVFALEEARRQGFRSVSLDLIYGLPFQSVESFGKTVQRVIEVNPDRISVFNYAHLPELFKPQRRINEEDLPSPAEKLEILQTTMEQLGNAGYVYIGMDHFAKPDDEMAVAQRNGSLYRNFQGYSTMAECDLIGLGVTSIGMVGRCYAQNVKGLDEYYEKIDAGKLPVFRGVELSDDDVLRREVITQLICHFKLDLPAIDKAFNIKFSDYFSTELEELKSMEVDGLLKLTDSAIKVVPAGRLLIRNICMVFDRYLREKTQKQRFSKVI